MHTMRLSAASAVHLLGWFPNTRINQVLPKDIWVALAAGLSIIICSDCMHADWSLR
jgi:hypothetical protein